MVSNALYVTQIVVGSGVTFTGIQFGATSFLGANIHVVLYGNTGTLLASSGSVALTSGTSNQRIPFGSPYTTVSGGTFFIGVQLDAAIQSGAYYGLLMVASARQTQGSFTLPSPITPPTLPYAAAANGDFPYFSTY